MKAEFKKKWIKALRSGKYRRAQGQLRKGRGFCCLGVLCHINGIDFNPCDGSLPTEFRKRVGLSMKDHDVLINLNDGEYNLETKEAPLPKGYREDKGSSFKQLAEWISRHV